MDDICENNTLLTHDDLTTIGRHAESITYSANRIIFAEGDEPDGVYFICEGQILILTNKFTSQEQISKLEKGSYFGEMAVLDQGLRAASAVADSDCELLKLDQDTFMELMKTGNRTALKINDMLAARYEELILTEDIMSKSGLNSNKLHVSIKGDPSLRESAFSRDRYDSIADKALSELLPILEDLILNHCPYQFFLSLSSEEVRIMSVFEPFGGQIHSCNKLLDKNYIKRHFPKIDYLEKTELIRELYKTLSKNRAFESTSGHYRKIMNNYYNNWQPVSKDEIKRTLSNIPALRTLPNFYIRNFSISMVHDAIRMQFNCDGTHIVSNDELLNFMKQNV
ncbi:hypothetical protein BOW53_04370 [Solemya pervernicosa gill symbiont]|uniref:Cyclic nucleotide-binding domain-containing protein n=2 Tax=Gammaproteobacteria incertae sedis TaxID=118884 RepID=A0A1T2L8U2_9GAMM|nr:cyclic nucleotide-binding domain-containing protein [Candidatus Reidiella endopervernicosa]OOZ41356.1 hypothetical protein BOW53_04370 [Solemya pervernicosa gill symbiont]QKQ27734.1 cyclic nucleotide-binding domain-containing protein [Candidatus Reidiella endopervernicosa]